MKTPIESFDALVGKTIERTFEFEETRVLTFSDGTYAGIRSETGYEGEREAPALTEVSLEYSYQAERLLKYGFVSQADVDEFQRKVAASNEASQRLAEEMERAQYERLKAKFG
jgi:hypothetical protein